MYTKEKKISLGFYISQFLFRISKGINSINFNSFLMLTYGKDSRITKLLARTFEADEEQQES